MLNGDKPIEENGQLLDLDSIRLTQDFGAELGVKKALLTVPVRRPDRQWFVRVRPEEDYRLQVGLIELRDEREVYLVEPSLFSELPGEVVPRILFTAINRQGVVFLWPVRLPGVDGKLDPWNRSAIQAAELATTQWMRIAANNSLGAYDVFPAKAHWLHQSGRTLASKSYLISLSETGSFKQRIIQSYDACAVRYRQDDSARWGLRF